MDYAKPYLTCRALYASTNIVTASWTLVSSSTNPAAQCKYIQVFHEWGDHMKMGYSTDGTTVTEIPMWVDPGGFAEPKPVYIPAGNALYLRAVTSTITAGVFQATYMR